MRIATLRVLLVVVILTMGVMAGLPLRNAAQSQIAAQEYEALVALYNATDGPNWTEKWTLPTDNPCGLYGVTCEDGHIVFLILTNNGLKGEIPVELGSLTNLLLLNLRFNELTGEIPSEWASLINLRGLYLSSNQLTGAIPSWLGSLENLTNLHLSDNQLTEEIPSDLEALTNLEELALSSNQLSGDIPTHLGSGRLRGLWLADNQLTGTIPSTFGNRTELLQLDLSGNQLSGPVPPTLGNLGKLTVLRLQNNQLSGKIPAELAMLSSVAQLRLGSNQLSGPIPTELGLGHLSSLGYLDLRDNQLSGEIPPELGNLPGLGWLDLGKNQLSGSIPMQLGSLSGLRRLDLDSNQLDGEIPAALGSMSELLWLNLSRNRLTGQISGDVGKLVKLESLDLSHNVLMGPVPSEIVNLTMLGASATPLVDVGHNHLWTEDPAVQAFLDERAPGWSETQTVLVETIEPADGGQIVWQEAQGPAVSISIPAGALTDTVTLVYYPMDPPDGMPWVLGSAGVGFDLQAYRDGALIEGSVFRLPMTVDLSYVRAEAAELDSTTLSLSLRQESRWLDAATTCTPTSSYEHDLDLGTLGVALCGPGSFFLTGERLSWRAWLADLEAVRQCTVCSIRGQAYSTVMERMMGCAGCGEQLIRLGELPIGD